MIREVDLYSNKHSMFGIRLFYICFHIADHCTLFHNRRMTADPGSFVVALIV